MGCKFICDGCGKEQVVPHYPGGWFKPNDWFERSDKDGAQVACSRQCIEIIAKKSGKTGVVIPI